MGVAICGVAHIIMIISAVPSIIQTGHAIGSSAFSLYMLAVRAALFKPNIAPTVLDQNLHKRSHVVTKSDEKKAIVDPEVTSEALMLWFYLLINIGAFLGKSQLLHLDSQPLRSWRFRNMSQELPVRKNNT
jgi:hypothetical protein